ncbi:MAG: hypothetical protein Q8R12_02775 [bacterium]|nr:hypothetical protein [bacterium]
MENLREARFIAYSTGSVVVVPKDMSETEMDEARQKLCSVPFGSIITVGEIGPGKLVFLVQPLGLKGHRENFLEAVRPSVWAGVMLVCARIGFVMPDLEDMRHAILETRSLHAG